MAFPDAKSALVLSRWPLEPESLVFNPSSANSVSAIWGKLPKPVPQFLHLQIYFIQLSRELSLKFTIKVMTIHTLLNKCFISIVAFLFLSHRQCVFCILLKERKLTFLSVSSYFTWKHFHNSALYSDSISWFDFV